MNNISEMKEESSVFEEDEDKNMTEEEKEKIDALRQEIMEHFKERVGEEMLETTNMKRYLRSCSWDGPESFTMFKSSVQLIKEFPQYVGSPSSCVLAQSSNLVWLAHQPHSSGSRILYLRLGQWNPSTLPLKDLYSLTFNLLLLASLETKTQLAGVIIVVDLTGFGFKHIRSLGIQEIRCLGNFLSGGFPLWFPNIHFVNNPRLFNTLYTLLKGFLSDRVKECIKFHGYNTAELVTDLPMDTLYSEVGGTHTLDQLQINDCMKSLMDKEPILVDLTNQLKLLAMPA